MKLKRLAWLAFVAAQSCLWGGCATSALWEEGRFARYHEPAKPPALRLFHSDQSQDVLVEYAESRELDDGWMRRRAYWLDRNSGRLEARRKPRFVSVERETGLVPIPVLGSPPVAAGQTSNSLYAVVSTNGSGFTLFSSDKPIAHCELPVYRDASGRVKQVLLTPPAVGADLTVIGGCIFLYAWASSGASWTIKP